jgi:peptide/nickel transport system substrate-binding protein
VRNVPEPATRRELVERGQADFTFDLTPQDNQALSHNPAVTVVAPYGTEVDYIYMTEYGPLASTYARQALSYAFNYDAAIKGILRGYARRAYGCLPSTMLGYDPNQFHYYTDLNKARALLQKAGVKPGTTLTYAYTEADTRAGEILQAQLAQLGITLKLQLMDEAAWDNIFYGNEPANRRPNLMPYGWWPDYNDPYDECVSLLATNQAPPAGSNGGMYHNAEVDALLREMKYANQDTLIRDAHRLQDITSRVDPPAIWVDEPAQATVLARSLQGFVLNPIELRTFDFYAMHR